MFYLVIALMMNPSVPICFNSSFETKAAIVDVEEKVPAMSVLTGPCYIAHLVIHPVNPFSALDNSVRVTEAVGEEPGTAGEAICFLYCARRAGLLIFTYRSHRSYPFSDRAFDKQQTT